MAFDEVNFENLVKCVQESVVIKLLILTTVSVIYIVYKLSYWQRNGIVNVPSSVFTQYIQPFQFADLQLIQKYGKIVGIYEFLTPSLLIADRELAWRIFVTDFHNFPERRIAFDGAPKVNENAIFILKYNAWKRVRSIVNTAFTTKKIKSMIPLIKVNVGNLMENIDNAAQCGRPVDIKAYFSAFTMDVILNTAFGTEVNAFQDPQNKLVKHARNLFGKNLSFTGFLFLICPNLAKEFNFSIFNYNSLMVLSAFAERIIKQRQASGIRRNDLLQSMLDCMNNAESTRLTLYEVIDQVLFFMIAGYESASVTLSSAVYCFALYSECQANLLNEIDSIDENKLFDYDTIENLKYLDAFIKEALRYYPTAPRFERRAICDCQLGHISIPKGTLVVVPVYAMNRDEENFENADQFKPERFINQNTEKNHAFQPFANGPRNCVGLKMAMLEMKLCLVSLLRKYKFEVCSQTAIPLEYFTGQLLAVAKNVTLKVTKR